MFPILADLPLIMEVFSEVSASGSPPQHNFEEGLFLVNSTALEVEASQGLYVLAYDRFTRTHEYQVRVVPRILLSEISAIV